MRALPEERGEETGRRHVKLHLFKLMISSCITARNRTMPLGVHKIGAAVQMPIMIIASGTAAPLRRCAVCGRESRGRELNLNMAIMQKVESRALAECTLWIVVIALAFYMIRTAFNSTIHAERNVISYTVILKETVSINGSHRPGVEVTRAVRSDGSEMFRMVETTPGRPMSSLRDIQFASGKYVFVNDLQGFKNTIERPAPAVPMLRDPASRCVNSLDGMPFVPGQVVIGEETVVGIRAVKIQASNAMWWFAMECGCAMIRSRVDFGDKGGVSEKELVSLIPGEPAPELFDVRTDFTEVPRSQVAKSVR